ncbi:A disintegrin and metalloproteinase with thrombospondin motifs 17-like isoform X2 [Amphiura filiformis]|uniref:A disintegrin and metalloproteinase with thrombospondin motifs 17-like isoform X2 n=1 Tax=Amphiura filiformis TaxID=82378 RepID=UPI003B215D07
MSTSIWYNLLLLLMSPVHLASQRAPVNEQLKHRLQQSPQHRHRVSRNRQRDSKRTFEDKVDFIVTPIIVELVIVADETFYDYHGNDTEHYIITVMTTVQKLWLSPTLGANVTLQINRLIVLPQQPEDLVPDEDADLYLKRFCNWKRELPFLYGDNLHYDVALLITRTNLHIGGNYDATGIGYILGACDPRHQCSINQDTHPMGLAMTIAHEIGHNLGMWHDGFHNAALCPDRTFLMSGYSVGGPRSLIWSQCSRQSMTDFLRSSNADCLKNQSSEPLFNLVHPSPDLPGYLYDADFQCRVLYGSKARDCSEWIGEKKCGELRCFPAGSSKKCETEKRPPLDGTTCGPNAICLSGYCRIQPSSKPDTEKELQNKSIPLRLITFSNQEKIISNDKIPKKQLNSNINAHQRFTNHNARQIQDGSKTEQRMREDIGQLMVAYVIIMVLVFVFIVVIVRKRRLCRLRTL